MGLLFTGAPMPTPGLGGYTYPISNPIITVLLPSVDDELCTIDQANSFVQLILKQGGIIPAGQPVYIRQQSKNELIIDPALLAAGYLPLVIEFAGPRPSAPARDQPPPNSQVVPNSNYPYVFSVNIGLMIATAPQIPGSTSNQGQHAFRTDIKVQVKSDGSFSWVGLDQPTWQGIISTATGSNVNA